MGSPSRSDTGFVEALFQATVDATVDVEAQPALVRFVHSLRHAHVIADPEGEAETVIQFDHAVHLLLKGFLTHAEIAAAAILFRWV
ncbi:MULTISPECIES: hypothetical protein [Bradyrhizobium]|uniref:Uncharacterized protein n=1 Tax=Bradyrhizobium elkanii TaxID=29448 RepID=A0A4U6S065_BRAEL|nr:MULTISPECIES: hypothetical protein [Bradyrhizobium]MTV14016.1 hypothetical protein [Bradyrhizobium sp. BR2003]TKV80331.1 hypothetical protein FDV58_16250 [Bradyrhizobium elkanii]